MKAIKNLKNQKSNWYEPQEHDRSLAFTGKLLARCHFSRFIIILTNTPFRDLKPDNYYFRFAPIHSSVGDNVCTVILCDAEFHMFWNRCMKNGPRALW